MSLRIILRVTPVPEGQNEWKGQPENSLISLYSVLMQMLNSAVCGAQDAALVTSTASDKTPNASWQAKSPNVAVVFDLPHFFRFHNSQ